MGKASGGSLPLAVGITLSPVPVNYGLRCGVIAPRSRFFVP